MIIVVEACNGILGKHILSLSLKNAVYWSHEDHWQHAVHPNPREKASFISENILPIQDSGQLQFVSSDLTISDNISVIMANGHTEKMMCPKIKYKDKNTCVCCRYDSFCGPYSTTLCYGVRHTTIGAYGKKTIRFLNEAIQNNYTLFFRT